MVAPKLVIASDGQHTAAVLDGVVIGRGIQRMDFSTEDQNGSKKSTLRVLDLDINSVELSTDTESFLDWVNGKK